MKSDNTTVPQEECTVSTSVDTTVLNGNSNNTKRM